MSSGFISEAEITEQRRLRQQEWERVRTADQPLEAPEEPYDSRSLYERLQEQKTKRDTEYEEAHKLKNMIKGLDDDEVEFLDLVDRTKLEEERKKNLEEEKEMRDFKAAVASLQEKSLNEKLKQELKNPQTANKNLSSGSSRTSQLKLLAGVVVKRSEKQKQEITRGVKRKLSSSDESKDSPKNEDCQENDQKVNENLECETSTLQDVSLQNETVVSNMGGMKCIGILPGLGSYDDSSDSDCSSDTDQDPEPKHSKYDLLGREIKIVKEEIVKEKS
ncbi:PREDICTED: protein FAM192A [Dufourea novaeangliae]|uniref:protein FAM192A n=1 Tax=Dufourea novaeangliae TaxID=178035 RepID=UPI000766E28C|nr:PREDICTED: protein FAM192A [Dufourea novaeangliae]XP_015433858.1 PREDICTED: protein FAM192A [Dufourea novaeangliae]XP_015433859.1 PREDICTED: protein FAM192A [Dufourea novaeangliae]XP_015433860.1 PREDICTED: protein FAM192A [Dufourea novaeangliae]